MKRVPQHELLDDDLGTSAEICASLSDLRHINIWFGGIATTRSLLRNAMHKAGLTSATVLEVASADGFCIRQAAKSLEHDGLQFRITLLDRKESHLASTNGFRTVVGDALHLPFDDRSFDFISCGLFIHHLSPEDVVRFGCESLRVCRHAVLINDLRRSAAHLALVYLGFPLFRSRITRHDGPASVRQSYGPAEISDLLKKTHARSIEITNHYLYRMAVTVWK
ncbi:MAG: methyltransferase domain-containing protein [Terriglobia bacterium]|jgi:ubiquinone/menaquinone biosynthesis C-methylase UbiE|nr:methyltransferase domain-containing protein [Terriglobia bacterium]